MQAKYGVNEVRYVDELAAVLDELAPPCLHVLDGGTNTDRRALQEHGPGCAQPRMSSLPLLACVACHVEIADAAVLCPLHHALYVQRSGHAACGL